MNSVIYSKLAVILITLGSFSLAYPQERENERQRDNPERLQEEARKRERQIVEIQERLRNLERQIHELREAGKSEAAEDHLREFNRVRERLGELKRLQQERRGNDRKEKRIRELPEEVRKRFENLRRELTELRKNGKLDAASRVERELQEFTARVRREFGERNKRRENNNAEKSPEERLRHLRAAVEHLRAAGLLEQAENVARQIGKFERAIEERQRNNNRERENRERENRERENRERENRERSSDKSN